MPVRDEKGKEPQREPPSSAPGTAELFAQCECPRLDPGDWDDVESDWSDIAFVKGAVNAVMGVPVGYAEARKSLEAKARALGAEIPGDAMLLIGRGRFRRDLLLEVEGAPRTAKGAYSPGGFAYSRLVEAPWGEMQRAVDETRSAAREKYGRDPDAMLIWYVTCRECSHERNFETLVIAHYREKR